MDFTVLLEHDQRTAMLFLWLVTGVGITDKNYLLSGLPQLQNLLKKGPENHRLALVSYWRIVGVPLINETEAIDWLFQWLSSKQVNSSIKSRATWVLVELTKKHPSLKQELMRHLEALQNQHSTDFQKRVQKLYCIKQIHVTLIEALMRQLATLILLLSLKGWSQTLQRYEVGLKGFGVYTALNPIALPAIRTFQIDYCNGVFFRYDTNAFAIRAQLNYQRSNGNVHSAPQLSEFYSMSYDATRYNLLLGFQKQLLKKKFQLYFITDIGYARKKEQGIRRGGWSGASEQFIKKSNGVLFNCGIGTRFQLYKQIYFTPELSYLSEIHFTKETTTPIQGGMFFQNNYTSYYLRPWLNGFITFAF